MAEKRKNPGVLYPPLPYREELTPLQVAELDIRQAEELGIQPQNPAQPPPAIMQAMMQQQNPALMQQQPQQAPRPAPQAGTFFGSDMGDAIFRGGAAMLGSGDGLANIGRGATAFMDTLDGREKMRYERELQDRPKVMQAAGGAFVQVVGKDGSVRTIATPEVQKYMRDQQDHEKQLQAMLYQQKAATTQENRTFENQYRGMVEAAGGHNTPAEISGESIQKIALIDQTIKTYSNPDSNPDTIAGYELPGVANVIDQTYGRAVGTKDYNARRDLDFKVIEEVAKTVKLYGTNPSNSDLKFAQAAVPRHDDSTESKLDWLNRAREFIKAAEQRRVQAARTRDEMAKAGSAASYAPPTAPAQAAPPQGQAPQAPTAPPPQAPAGMGGTKGSLQNVPLPQRVSNYFN